MNLSYTKAAGGPAYGFQAYAASRNAADNPFKQNYRNIYQRTMSSNENHHVTLKLGYLYSEGSPATGQELHMKYDESSMEHDPVMLITGKDMEGNEFTERIHLNSIDPQNATPAEMTALSVHLREQGDEQVNASSGIPLMAVGGKFDVNTKMDFKEYYETWIADLKNAGFKQKADIYMCELERYLFHCRAE